MSEAGEQTGDVEYWIYYDVCTGNTQGKARETTSCKNTRDYSYLILITSDRGQFNISWAL